MKWTMKYKYVMRKQWHLIKTTSAHSLINRVLWFQCFANGDVSEGKVNRKKKQTNWRRMKKKIIIKISQLQWKRMMKIKKNRCAKVKWTNSVNVSAKSKAASKRKYKRYREKQVMINVLWKLITFTANEDARIVCAFVYANIFGFSSQSTHHKTRKLAPIYTMNDGIYCGFACAGALSRQLIHSDDDGGVMHYVFSRVHHYH